MEMCRREPIGTEARVANASRREIACTAGTKGNGSFLFFETAPMLLPNDKLLASFRTPGKCELCNRWASIKEPHHLRTVGACGGPIDIRINLISCGSSKQ